jgi:maltooligosyltrehalose trehalohydrolase
LEPGRLDLGTRPFGAVPLKEGVVAFRVWAPRANRVQARVAGRLAELTQVGGGIWEAQVPAAAGEDYVYILDGEQELADPCSRFQPEGIRGPSRIVDPAAFTWTDDAWEGLRLDELVVYELHVGTFAEEGTFEAAIPHLPELRELGVTAVELMPVATFPGNRSWGYDGVYAFAPHPAYGGPEGLARLVDAAHDADLGVILDVVYNHVGPGSERIAPFGPYFTDRWKTPWGEAMNFAEQGVREWAIQNACAWVRDYHADGLRLDAVFAIYDESPHHVLAELAERVRAARSDALVISETHSGDRRPLEEWGHDAQWWDFFHHALHALLTGEREGYYEAFGLVEQVARAFEQPEAERLVVCAQNHDQVGNRPRGDRLSREQLRVAAHCVFFSPFTPLLFMGEEYGEERPFQFFADHDDPAIAEATREGRRREFADLRGFAAWDLPDPQDSGTFARSRLDRSGADPELEGLYRRLLSLRSELPPGRVLTELSEEGRRLRVRRGRAELLVDFDRLTAEIRT